MGAGPARSSVISVPHPTKLAMVSVNVAQVGDVHAMVDSGAMVSVVRKDIVESILKEENKFGGYVVGFDKIKVPVVGEIALSVQFEGVAAELKRVKIVENSLYDMILGAEWLEKGRIIVYAEDGRLTAHVRPHGLDFSLKKLDTSEPPIQDSCAAVSISMVPGLVADDDFQNDSFLATSSVREIPALGLGLQSDWPVFGASRNSRCSTYQRTLDPIVEEVPESSLPDSFGSFLGSIFLDNDIPASPIPFYANVRKRTVLPPGGMRFVRTDVPCTIGDVWVVTKSFSSQPSREWIIPNCLVTASKRALHIPVVNLSNQPLQWNEGNALATVELLCTSVIPLNTANDE